ncbi:DUF3040 domain-containing protein [Actinomadura madurae]|uniref:DUF3040 domain-containing protein n=1 Tax=Actinomadura madurae TaxID=1993 RepID=UPI0020D22BEE|nr:DUF3040 domain-containing protein [Actinomadura madurae]MCP9949587.1 DUF3040 domain-containing protein [Actinomadura madurae]MCQ0009640.1 DUF3040 domain-containing protein [Actinomadura madurae]MCQ0015020.1 DUF3040 domain-containing protein [Actinomadura madurae]
MGLRRDQQAVLAQIDADLERADPELARRLRSMLGPAGDAAPCRRPPRSVVMLAAVLAAAAVFLATMIILMMPQPCRARPPTTGGPSTPAASGPSTPARGRRDPLRRPHGADAARACSPSRPSRRPVGARS